MQHVLATFERRSDFRRVLYTGAESWRVQPERMVVCDAGEAVLGDSGQETPQDEMYSLNRSK